MITFKLFLGIHDLIEELKQIALVQSENSNSFRIEADPISGRYIFGGVEGEFEFRFFDVKLNEDLQTIRSRSNLEMWYLSNLYGNIGLSSQVMSTQPIGAIAIAEMHNLKRDDTVIFKAPGHVRGCSIRMGKKFLLSSTPETETFFPFLKETRHFAMLESLDHEMIEALAKIFRIRIDSPVFINRIETSARDISYYFLEKVAHRKKDLHKMNPDDSFLQRMLHVNSLFNDYNHPPTLQQISHFVGMGPAQTNNLFKQVYGKTPYQFFNEKRMNEAYDLLHTGKYNISQIGTMLGFANMSHFSKAYKKRFGTLPKKMQQQSVKHI